MKKRKKDNAVSEVVDMVLLLAISIILFSAVQYFVLTYPSQPSIPSARITGHIYNNEIILEHLGGEALSTNSKIIYTIGDTPPNNINVDGNFHPLYSDDDDLWEIGEIVNIDIGNSNDRIKVIITDGENENIIMSAILQEL
jgi:hypothetical protein